MAAATYLLLALAFLGLSCLFGWLAWEKNAPGFGFLCVFLLVACMHGLDLLGKALEERPRC